MSQPRIQDLLHRALDVTAPEYVEVQWDAKRGVLYISVEGATLFRACRIKKIAFTGAVVETASEVVDNTQRRVAHALLAERPPE